MYKSLIIARCTMLEMVREKIFLVMLGIGILLLLFSILLGELTLAEQAKVIADIGFGTVELASVVFVCFSCSYLISKELEKQTILIVMARPISHFNFLFGKFLGALGVAAVMVSGLSLLVLILIGNPDFLAVGLIPMFGNLMQVTILSSLALLFSNLVRPVLALALTLLIYATGHWLPDVEFFASRSGDAIFVIGAKILKIMVPNLFRFNWKNFFVLEAPIPLEEIGWATIHTGLWTIVALGLAYVSFKRRDFV